MSALRTLLTKSPSDIVFLTSLRTPLTRSKKGGLKDSYPEQLLSTVLRATLTHTPSLPPFSINDVCVGTVLQELGGAKSGRMASLHAGVPYTSGFYTINRQCASSLAAITAIGNSLRTGEIEVGIAAGMESMSRNYGSRAIPTVLWPELKDEAKAERYTRECVMPMGLTSENVAERYGVGRKEQDEFAANSHRKAAKARKEGWFKEEIVPVKTLWMDPDKGIETEMEVREDDGIREGVSAEGLGKLKSAFKEGGASTAGNSSQVTDGAAACLMMRRSKAEELGLGAQILGKWAGTQVAGCEPGEMGVGPAVAVPKLLAYLGVKKEDVGIWELNEAFASQSLYCIRKLGIEEEKVNPKGGAIALGHPLGATGARMLATLLPELMRQGQEVGVLSMCMSTGMGMASLIIRE